ncbi:uncharacterized protein [Nicotiana sylvestris]|uniref:Uncharacterized protein LOC104224755 n=1 Tax=Nicotiana sylvestris TaxID=4096 RepID=A0A1U7WKH2_NICSY|nr:PREDICTED: uncharacterized protein LOC104224755 [Nicotiana sylvestris]
MAGSSNRSPSPLSAKPIPPHPRTSENTNSTARRSFNGNPFSRPSVLSTHRGFNPVTPANSPADSAKRVSNSGKEGGFEEKENELKAVKLRSSAAKGSKNFMSPTISASSKIASSPKKKILVERNDPLRTSISLSDGKATFFNASSENYDVGFELSNSTVKSMEKTEILLEPKEENVVVEEQGLTPVAKTPKKVTFLEVPLPSETLSDTVTMDSDICNDEPILVSTLIAPLDADPSLPPYDPKTNYLSPRPQFLHYKPNRRIEVLLNKEKGLDVVGGAKSLDDSFLSELLLSDNISDTEDSESSQTAEESLKESDGSSSEEMLLEAAVDQEEEEEPKITEPAAEEIAEAKMRTKPRSSVISKFFSLLLVLLIALVLISVTDSPLLTTTPGSIDLRFSNLSIPSDIPVLAKANSYFKQFSGEAISYFSKLIYDLGSIPSDIPVHPLKFMNLTDVQDSGIDHWYLKGGTGSVELDKGLELVELEEDEESKTETNEEEVQIEADLDDDGNEEEVEGAHELEIEEASTIQLDEENEADSSENDQEQGQDDLETEEVSVVLVAEGNESISSERDLDQGEHELAETKSFNVDNDASSDAVVESVNVNPESLVKDDSSGEDAQPLEGVQSPIDDRFGDNVQILGISSVILSVLAAIVIYFKTKNDKTLQPVVYSDHIVKEKHSSQNWPTEVDVMGESCPSEMSSFQISSSYSKKYPKSANDEAQSMEKKPRKSNRRESLAASEYSLGSPSYGSFTTYERIPIKHVSGGEEIITPVRRSSRIRSHVTSP